MRRTVGIRGDYNTLRGKKMIFANVKMSSIVLLALHFLMLSEVATQKPLE